MTTLQFRAILVDLGINQVEAATLLGSDARTVRHWHNGDRAIPAPVARFLNYLRASGTRPSKVLRLIGE